MGHGQTNPLDDIEMSLLAELFAEEKIFQPQKTAEEKKSETPPVAATFRETPRDHGAVSAPSSPCPACGSFLFWHSKYDRVLRCMTCQPDPPRGLLGGIVDHTPGQDLESVAGESGPGDSETPRYRDYSPAYIAQHFPPWPDWSKKPGSWRRELPSEDGDGSGSDPDSNPEAPSTIGWRESRSSPELPQHKEPNPGCLRDYRGKGGSCTHPLACLSAQFVESYTKTIGKGDKRSEKRFNQMRITCSCGKFVGYRSDPVG